jgi:hypothetical protein
MSTKQLVPPNLLVSASNPSTPTLTAGDMYYNSADNSIRVYNGTSWVIFTASINPIATTFLLGGM